LAGAIAVCPTIDPTQCAKAFEAPRNGIYHYHFLTQLKRPMRRKARLFLGKRDLAGLDGIRILSEFDDRYTAPDGGYASGADYYDRSGARSLFDSITVPTRIITSQDDPFIPYFMFMVPLIERHPKTRVAAPRHGGLSPGAIREKIPTGQRIGLWTSWKTAHSLCSQSDS
jgi:predicted alpha/beta-fold hydrolase